MDEGKFYAILGSNGAGKSTFMRLLSGVESFQKGSIKINGLSTIGEDFQVENPIALITEELNFELNASLKSVVKHFSSFYKEWDQEKFNTYISTRNFDLMRKYSSLSRGQKVQFSLMIYLAANVQYFIVDEVTSVLDLYSRNFFLKELKEVVQRGGTVVLATNIISEVSPYADHVILLQNKGIKLDQEISEIPNEFIKINREKGYEHEIFSDPNCFWAGDLANGITTYIISKEDSLGYKIDNSIVDENISLEDVFVFYFKSKLGGEYEEVA